MALPRGSRAKKPEIDRRHRAAFLAVWEDGGDRLITRQSPRVWDQSVMPSTGRGHSLALGCSDEGRALTELPERSEGPLPVDGITRDSTSVRHSWPKVRPRSSAVVPRRLRRGRVEEGQDDREQQVGAT